ncbi:MAG: DUF1553 domain-containing protein, partial [Planctomycetaceae bacterium]|nr:DUF1553 domain-containing protein [Planctomycetaceae bacterium]
GNGTTEIIARFRNHEARTRVIVSRFDEHLPIDFRTTVVGALSRGGCNQGGCHGSPKGKNGFRLSLRGFDPDVDYRFLTRDVLNRRVNRNVPESSLLLLKASGRIAHQGGSRFRRDEPAYQTLVQWVTEGCRDSAEQRTLDRLEVLPSSRILNMARRKQPIVVRAHYEDGSIQDVTDLAVFSTAEDESVRVSRAGVVEFQRTAEAAILVRFLDKISTVRLTYIQTDPNFASEDIPARNFVDQHVFTKQRQLQLRPAGLSGDAVFLRRVYLDLIGAIPTPDDAREFLDSKDPLKRQKLIDQLLNRDEYAQFWAMKWADVMRGNRETISERGVHNLHRYLVSIFAKDQPFDGVAREIITSLGNTIHEPAAHFYRVSRTPNDAAESFSQLFLGVRIQCAKCHNHPYESITQQDYYGLAAYFSRVKLKGKRFGLDDETVYLARTGEVKFPETENDVAPVAFGKSAGDLKPGEDRRVRLADWLTDPGNKFFPRSVTNRIWYHLMGQGIVDPIDDFRDSNLPSNAALLDALAQDFIKHGYRFKPVMRSILNSRTYQLSAEFRGKQSSLSAKPDRYFTQSIVRMLEAEQIIDAISSATGVPERFPNYPLGTRAVALAEGAVSHKFLQAFTKPIRDVGCECARETDPTLNQVVHLLNNPELLDKIESPHSRLGGWIENKKTNTEIVELLYLATLSRRPTAAEQKVAADYLQTTADRSIGLRDLQHALLMSNEFLLRH